MADFAIKAGDTQPVFEVTLQSYNGSSWAPVNLTGATVTFWLRRPNGSVVIAGGAASVVTPATSGVVRYTFTAADTATPGSHEAEFKVDFGAGQTLTFPDDPAKPFLEVEILERV